MAAVEYPLLRHLPAERPCGNEAALYRFLDYLAERGLELYPAQEEALLALFDERNVILNTPTGSGKSLVATALHFKGLAQGKRSVYTCPIKALVNEKFLALCRDFGPEQVGMSTGDATVNRDAPILCCTAEILANIALREGESARVDEVIMDEFHYYSDRERGVAWQVPLLALPQARFLLMSATLGDPAFFEEELTRRNGRPTSVVRSRVRPVPLEFSYSEVPFERAIEDLAAQGRAPIYIVHFTQLDAAESAQSLLSLNFCSREEKEAIARALEDFRFDSPYGADLKKYLRHGIGLHHAGLLPKYRVRVEQLAQQGLLKIICGTDTLGLGINVPIRTVLLTRLCKFDGEKTGIVSVRDFHQICGRAGRKGFDDRGWVVVQAPEHVIENLRLANKGASDSGKARKFVKRKPPERNFVSWDRRTFDRLVASAPERLASRFQVTHGMLLNVLSRAGDGCEAMRELVRRSHETPPAKRQHLRRAWVLFRSLLDRKIIEFVPRTDSGAYLRVNVALQEDFSLDQTLSLYLLDTLQLLDPESPAHALDLLTLVESILEDPDVVLHKQLSRLKAEKIAEMKMQGLDFAEREAELEKLEYPKPNRDFVYSTFNEFAGRHPWVGQENIRPKSVAREMYESLHTFADYIRHYDLQKAEGVVLRYLSYVYKTLAQTVPDTAKTDPVREIELYFGQMIRDVDSSLLDEWEKLRQPGQAPVGDRAEPAGPAEAAKAAEAADITRDRRQLTLLARQSIFGVLRLLATGRLDEVPALLDPPVDAEGQEWNVAALEARLAAHGAEHSRICLDPDARNARHTYVEPSEDGKTWRIDQVLVDPEGHNDWRLEFHLDLERARRAGRPVLRLMQIGPVGTMG